MDDWEERLGGYGSVGLTFKPLGPDLVRTDQSEETEKCRNALSHIRKIPKTLTELDVIIFKISMLSSVSCLGVCLVKFSLRGSKIVSKLRHKINTINKSNILIYIKHVKYTKQNCVNKFRQV